MDNVLHGGLYQNFITENASANSCDMKILSDKFNVYDSVHGPFTII